MHFHIPLALRREDMLILKIMLNMKGVFWLVISGELVPR
jgi:hypothetical protein